MAYENLRPFLLEIPILAEAIESELAASPSASHNSDDVRLAFEAARQRTMAFLRAEKLPYAIVAFPDVVGFCPECDAELKGAYWELNHPEGAGTSFPHLGMHLFVEHGCLRYEEPITNLAGNVLGQHTIAFDTRALAKILDGLPLPPEVQADVALILAEVRA